MADRPDSNAFSLFVHATVSTEIQEIGLGRTEAEARATLVARLSDGEPVDGEPVDADAEIASYGVALVVRGDRADVARFVSALRLPADLPAWLGGGE